MTVLEKDKDIRLPQFTVLKASAGSGKTHALAKRFVQFLLSDRIPRNTLSSILAITFSNNAAKEMRERILLWLKSICLNDPVKVEELAQIVSLDREELCKKAERLMDEILGNYADFQVKTIDSFMASIFKSSAIDLGFYPDFDILMSNDSLLEYAFDLFLRRVKEGTDEQRLLGEVISIMLENKRSDSSYPWDPSKMMLEEIKKIYRKLSSVGKEVKIVDHSLDIEDVKDRMRRQVEKMERMMEEAGIPKSKNFDEIISSVKEGRFTDLIGKGLKKAPVNAKRNDDLYRQLLQHWSHLGHLIKQYTFYYARTYYNPYLKIYEALRETIEMVKKQQGKVFIEDINKKLAEYLKDEIVPDVYFRIGETIFHYLIDEFQDTSPIQWKNLYPLIENSLSQGGSLFVVGDTKQAIYGFREADFSIMKRFEKETPFPSAQHNVKELNTNYRSLHKIVEFNEDVFKRMVANTSYRDAGERSGLVDYNQNVRHENGDMGYVEVSCLEKNEEDPEERAKIQGLIQELHKRGYGYGDIAILTPKNDDVVRVTTWLNEINIPSISYSNLDIRRRRITAEVISVLNFLDSPIDDLSFTTFILSELFDEVLKRDGQKIGKERLQAFLFRNRENPPLYKAFQEEFPNVWEHYFEGLFKSVGYLPLYDLVAEIFRVFKVFEIFDDEEATLAKILEVIKNFEDTGNNNLKDFLDFVDKDEDESQWNVDVPKGINAVKVMTIHKAKGLEFPVVIVLLYGERLNKGFTYIAQQDEDRVLLLKINKNISQTDPYFHKLYNEEKIKGYVNGLNTLYVGFTRAEAEMYIIGVKAERDRYPFELLPMGEYLPSCKPDRIHRKMEDSAQSFPVYHHQDRMETPFRAGRMKFEEKKRGEFIHKVFYLIDYVDEHFEKTIEGIVKKVADELRDTCYEEEAKKLVLEFLENEEIREYFNEKPGREIRKEQDFSDAQGRLSRMDRIIIDRDRVTVIDYKTGRDGEAEEEHSNQMRNYMHILGEVFPGKKIEGILAYVDLKEIKRIR